MLLFAPINTMGHYYKAVLNQNASFQTLKSNYFQYQLNTKSNMDGHMSYMSHQILLYIQNTNTNLHNLKLFQKTRIRVVNQIQSKTLDKMP